MTAHDLQGSAERMKEKLSEISPSFCSAKWLMASLHLQSGQTHSCHLPPTHRIPAERLKADPTALHNTPHKLEQRRLMLEGRRPSECRSCWEVEDAPGGHLSERFYRSGETWALSDLDGIRSLSWNASVAPRSLEVSFGSTCNFKCSYCAPHISTKWMEEIRESGAYPLESSSHNDLGWLAEQGIRLIPESEENPYLEAFWKWWPELYPSLRVFRLTGGEPLLNRNTYRLLEWIAAHPHRELELAITSNMGSPPELMRKFISHLQAIPARSVRSVRVYVSLDSWGRQAEYIRHGMDFPYLLDNVRTLLRDVAIAQVCFIHTFNALSAVGLRRFLEGMLELRGEFHSKGASRVGFDTPVLRAPEHQSARILTPELKNQVSDAIAFMTSRLRKSSLDASVFERLHVSRLERVQTWLWQPIDPEFVRVNRSNFYRFFREHDRRRGTDFLANFPEMAEFWGLCARAAEGPR